MRYRSLPFLLLCALAACNADPVAPELPDAPVPDQGRSGPVSLAIADVFDRILPSLEGEPGAGGLRAALEAVPVDGTAAERILLRLEADPAHAADVGAIRLALTVR